MPLDQRGADFSLNTLCSLFSALCSLGWHCPHFALLCAQLVHLVDTVDTVFTETIKKRTLWLHFNKGTWTLHVHHYTITLYTSGTSAKGYQLCRSPTPPQRNNSIEIDQNSLHCFWRTSQGSWQGGGVRYSHIHTYIYQPLLCGSSNWAFFLLIFRHFLRNTFSLPIFKFLDLLWMGRGEVGQEDPWDRAAIALSLFTPCLTLPTLLFLLLFSTLLTSFVYSTLLTFFCTFYFLLHFLLYSFLLLLLLIIHPLSNSSYSLYFYSFYSFFFLVLSSLTCYFSI